MNEITGWLMDVYEDPLGGAALWVLGDDGRRCPLHQPFPVAFTAQGPAERLEALARFLTTLTEPPRVTYTTRQDVFARGPVRVLAVQSPHPAAQTSLFRKVQRAFPNLDYADADLPLSLRYAAAEGVGVLGRCRVQVDHGDRVHKITALDDPWKLDWSALPLRVLSLAPDCNPTYAAPRALKVGYDDRMHCFPLKPARSLLVNLRALLQQYDPDLLLTDWGDTWLLPLLLDLAEQHQVDLPLNRDRFAQAARRDERWYFSYGQLVYRGAQVHLCGRWHVDRQNAVLWKDLNLEGLLETTRVTGLPLQTAARTSPGTGISAIQMLTALRQGVLVPWQKPQAEYMKPALDLFSADQGGLVYQPPVGVHRNVAEIDFISMYPAIMVHHNISPETIHLEGADGRGLLECVPGLTLAIDHQAEGLVARALRPLLQKRVALKERLSSLPAWHPQRKVDSRRAAALKWLLVTCFGYLGYKNARFGRIEAHQAVTAYGREALLLAKEAAEDLDFEVLQMYVDGLWVHHPGKTRSEDMQDLLEAVRARSGLPIALDGIYRWLVFLPSRTYPNRSVANRYFGVFQSGEIKARGIAARRRDTPLYLARVQMELIELLARAGEPEDALPEAARHLRSRLVDLRAGRVALEELTVAQRLTREIADYRSPSPAARAAQQIQSAGRVIKPGQRVRFIFTRGEPGVWAWDPSGTLPASALDYFRYHELLLRAAREVLTPFGWREAATLFPIQ